MSLMTEPRKEIYNDWEASWSQLALVDFYKAQQQTFSEKIHFFVDFPLGFYLLGLWVLLQIGQHHLKQITVDVPE